MSICFCGERQTRADGLDITKLLAQSSGRGTTQGKVHTGFHSKDFK